MGAIASKRFILSNRFARSAALGVRSRLEDSQRSRVDAFETALQDGRLIVEFNDCPCGAQQDVTVAEVDRYGLPLSTVLCRRCGTLRTNPYLDRASLDQFYREIYQQLYGHSPALEDYFARQQAYAKCILALYAEELPSVADVLEVGCGAGGALAVFQREGHRVAGCELSQEQLAYGTQQGVIDLWHGTIDDAPANIFQRRFDLIFLHHVFEHLPSPRETLFALGSWLKPTGRILIIVPDITRVDCFPNPAGDILRFLHVAHKYNFTAGCLQIVAAHAGLHAVSKRPPSHLKTDWSQMPELWMEFRPAEVTCKAPASGCDSGSMVLQYLLATEQRFLAGDFLAPGATHGVAAQVATPQRNVVARLWHWAKRRAVKKAA